MTTPAEEGTVAVVRGESKRTMHDHFDRWLARQQNGNAAFAAIIPMRRVACMFADYIITCTDMKTDSYDVLKKKFDDLEESFDDYKGQVESAKDSITEYLSQAESACDDLEI